jgi:hypothetical protein
MSSVGVDELQDEAAPHWNWLEDEPDPCVVVSERMEFVYAHAAARELVPGRWFGKRCFELLPVVDETCAFHCPKITAVTESTAVVYCEETVCSQGPDCDVFGVGVIPLGTDRVDRGRAVLLMRGKDEGRAGAEFEVRPDARGIRDRIVARSA